MIEDTQTAPHSSPSPRVSKEEEGASGPSLSVTKRDPLGNKGWEEVSSEGPQCRALRTVNMTQLEGQGCPSLRDSPVKNSLCGENNETAVSLPIGILGG